MITSQNKYLIRIAGSLNLLFLLLAIGFILFLGFDHSEHQRVTKKAVLFMVSNILCWILNVSILTIFVPVNPGKKVWQWVSFYLSSYLISFLLAIFVAHVNYNQLISDEQVRSPVAGPVIFIVSINTLSLVAIEFILLRFSSTHIKMEIANMKVENSELKMKSLEAQHEKLKNQLHPHFLFNSLTALKSLIRKDAVLAEDYLIKLSEFLRFSISHNEHNVVGLEEELKFSMYYLDMQKIRFRNSLKFDIDIPGEELKYASLPVFSLQLLLENAIKHNRLTQERPLHIRVKYIHPDWLMVENNLNEKLKADPESGIGLKNLSDRYKLLTEEDIKVLNDADYFRVYIKIIRE